MTSFKSLSLVAIVLVVAATVSSSPVPSEKVDVFAAGKSNDLIVGHRHPKDILVHTENIAEKFLVSGKKLIITKNIQVPYGYIITQVRAIDKAADGTGAEVTVIGGGPDAEFISLRFKSQRWRGIYFDVQVFAKPRY